MFFSLRYHLKPHLHFQCGPRFVCVGSVHTSRLQPTPSWDIVDSLKTKVTASSYEASKLRVCALLDSTPYFLYGSEASHHIKPKHHRVPCDGGSCGVAVIVAVKVIVSVIVSVIGEHLASNEDWCKKMCQICYIADT